MDNQIVLLSRAINLANPFARVPCFHPVLHNQVVRSCKNYSQNTAANFVQFNGDLYTRFRKKTLTFWSGIIHELLSIWSYASTFICRRLFFSNNATSSQITVLNNLRHESTKNKNYCLIFTIRLGTLKTTIYKM